MNTDHPNLKLIADIIRELVEEARDEERSRCVAYVDSYFDVYDSEMSLYEAGRRIAYDLARAEWK